MKTYRYKNNSGDWVRSIYPKPTKDEEVLANGMLAIITIMSIIGMLIYLII